MYKDFISVRVAVLSLTLDIRLHKNRELDIRLQGHWTFAYIKTKDWTFAYTSKKRTGHSPT